MALIAVLCLFESLTVIFYSSSAGEKVSFKVNLSSITFLLFK